MHRLKKLWTSLTNTEHRFVVIALVVFAASSVAWLAINVRERSVFIPVAGGSYVEALIGQPIAINPIISSNPADQDISRIIYSNLDSLINDSRIESDDRTYVLKLKEDLFWDDGETLTSDDVIFTIKTIQNPDARSTFSRPWHGVVTERISDLQLKLTLPTPYAFFNETIAKLPVIPRHIFGAIPTANLKLSTYNLEPVGSGPYRFKSFSKRKDGFITNYRLVVNERYHGSKPFIKNFVFEFYNTHDEIIDALRFRRVDGFGSMTPIMSSLKTASYLNLNRLPMPRYYALFLNPLSNSKLKIKEIRKALTEAIDTKTIASDALQGEALPIEKKSLYYHEPNNTSNNDSLFNPSEAKKLIEDWKKRNKDTNLELNLVVPNIDFLKQIAERVVSSWRSIGVDQAEIRVVDSEHLINDVIKPRGYDALLFGNVLEHPDDLFPFWHSSQRFYPGLNLSLYQNTEADKLIESIRQKDGSFDERTNDLAKLTSLIREDYPAVFLFSLPYFYIHTDRLNGWSSSTKIINPSDRFENVAEWYIEQARTIE